MIGALHGSKIGGNMLALLQWLWRWLVSLWRGLAAALRGLPVEADELLDMRRIIAGMWPILLSGFIFALFVCEKHWARGAMWCFSCLAVGAGIGFLFGIPKVLQGDRNGSRNTEYRQRVNTNLEEISDWLTKIIVGLGLIQLAKIPSWIDRLASLFADSVIVNTTERGVLAAIIVFFSVGGFLFGYLITRLFLQGALGRADRAAAFPDEGSLRKGMTDEKTAKTLEESNLSVKIPSAPAAASPPAPTFQREPSVAGVEEPENGPQ